MYMYNIDLSLHMLFVDKLLFDLHVSLSLELLFNIQKIFVIDILQLIFGGCVLAVE